MLILWRTLEKDNSTTVQPLSPLLCFVSAIVHEQQLWLRWYSSILGMDLKLFLHRTITISGNISLVIWSSFKRLFLMFWQSTTSLSHLYIKEWRLEDFQETHSNFTSAKTLLKLFHIKSSLRISFQRSYLRNSRVLKCLYLICIVNTTDFISSVQPQTIFFVILFE